MDLLYTSSGINKQANNLDLFYIDEQPYLTYGSNVNISICKLIKKAGNDEFSAQQPILILKGHINRVNCVVPVIENDKTLGLLSGDSSGIILHWEYNESKWSIKNRYQHTGSITSITYLNHQFYVADNAGIVNFYKLNEPETFHSIDFGKHNMLCLKACEIDNSILLFLGGTDKKLYLYTIGDKVEMKLKLDGHEDWIRSIDIKIIDEEVYVATGCQDTFIRIYKIGNNTFNQEGKLSNKVFQFYIQNNSLQLILDTIITGHLHWVYCVKFNPNKNQLSIASSSADKSILIHEPDLESNLWLPKTQLGEVGGNTLGFYGVVYFNNHVFGCGYHGAVHYFINQQNQWRPIPFISGHTDQVKSLAWDPQFEFLVSVSLDQSSRCFALNSNFEVKEIARAQIHGYDLNKINFIKPLTFASAADEKVLRILKATKQFCAVYNQFNQINKIEDKTINDMQNQALLPALGLSNKMVDEQQLITDLPTEEVLMQATLWPEMDKLYGHGYELLSLATSHQQKYLASTCKANTTKHAVIRIFDIDTLKELQPPLEAHSLSIVAMDFNNNDSYFISGGKDRSIALFKYTQDKQGNPYRLVCKVEKAHARIIWNLRFLDKHSFVSTSRDGLLKVWIIKNDQIIPVTKLEVGTSTTALDIIEYNNSSLFALGLENGNILLYNYKENTFTSIEIDQSLTPAKQINQLQFRFIRDKLLLAIAAADATVALFEVKK